MNEWSQGNRSDQSDVRGVMERSSRKDASPCHPAPTPAVVALIQRFDNKIVIK